MGLRARAARLRHRLRPTELRFLRHQQGLETMEWALVGALVVVAVLAVWHPLGQVTDATMSDLADSASTDDRRGRGRPAANRPDRPGRPEAGPPGRPGRPPDGPPGRR